MGKDVGIGWDREIRGESMSGVEAGSSGPLGLPEGWSPVDSDVSTSEAWTLESGHWHDRVESHNWRRGSYIHELWVKLSRDQSSP